jgi:hypothetical protein
MGFNKAREITISRQITKIVVKILVNALAVKFNKKIMLAIGFFVSLSGVEGSY